MEPVFENRYIFERSLMKEYINQLLRSQRIFGAVCAVLALGMGLLNRGKFFGAFFLACFLILVLALLIQGPMALNRLDKANRALHNGAQVETVYRLGEKQISLTEGDTAITIQYAQITSIRETKSLYLLMMGGQNAVMLKKDGFTLGNPAELEEFLKERCENL